MSPVPSKEEIEALAQRLREHAYAFERGVGFGNLGGDLRLADAALRQLEEVTNDPLSGLPYKRLYEQRDLDYSRARDRMEKAEAERDAAYARGASDMREAVIRLIADECYAYDEIERMTPMIRALPIPGTPA